MRRRSRAGLKVVLPVFLPLLSLLMLSVALPASAQTDAVASDSQGSTPHQEFLSEIDGIFARETEQLAALQSEFTAAADEQTALAVQRRIADLRQATEIAVLGAQAGFARRLGRTELAQQIEADIAALRDPERAAKLARPEDTRR